MFWSKIRSILKWLCEQLDVIIALLIGIVCSILGILGVVQLSLLTSATLGILSVVAFSLIRDRLEREKLQNNIRQLHIKSVESNPEYFLVKGLNETIILQGAEKEILLIQETGTYIIETSKAAILSLLKRGGEVKIVVACPTDDITKFLALRNCDFTPEGIVHRQTLFSHYIENIVMTVNTEKLQVRFSPYIFDTSSAFIDSNNAVAEKRKAIVRYPGFRVPFEERIGMSVQGNSSPRLFSHFYEEAQRLFEYTHKFIVCINLYSKNNSIFRNFIDEIGPEGNIHFFSLIFKFITQINGYTGFEVATTDNPTPRKAMTFIDDGTTTIDPIVWVSIISEWEEAYKTKKIMILDGISTIQLYDKSFFDMLSKLLNDPTITVFITLALKEQDIENSLVRQIKSHYRTTVNYLINIPRKNTESNITTELKASLVLAKIQKFV